MPEKSFIDIGHEIGQLLEAKNLAYGNSFERSGEIMSILYPNGIPPEGHKDALAVVRIIDKLFRIANAKGAFGEDPWRDIAGYAILSLWSQHNAEASLEELLQGRIVDPGPPGVSMGCSTAPSGCSLCAGGEPVLMPGLTPGTVLRNPIGGTPIGEVLPTLRKDD